MSIAQQYNIYPVQKPVFPTPVQFMFIGEEEFQNLLNDVFRDDSYYLFLQNYIRYILSKYFKQWKRKTTFPAKKVQNIKKKKTSTQKVSQKSASKNIELIENEDNKRRRIKWLNDNYEISPIDVEYYSQKKLKPTKASNRLFKMSLKENQIGDFENDVVWQKIINHY